MQTFNSFLCRLPCCPSGMALMVPLVPVLDYWSSSGMKPSVSKMPNSTHGSGSRLYEPASEIRAYSQISNSLGVLAPCIRRGFTAMIKLDRSWNQGLAGTWQEYLPHDKYGVSLTNNNLF